MQSFWSIMWLRCSWRKDREWLCTGGTTRLMIYFDMIRYNLQIMKRERVHETSQDGGRGWRGQGPVQQFLQQPWVHTGDGVLLQPAPAHLPPNGWLAFFCLFIRFRRILSSSASRASRTSSSLFLNRFRSSLQAAILFGVWSKLRPICLHFKVS